MDGKPFWNLLLIDDDEEDYLLTKIMLAEMRGSKAHLEWIPTLEEGRRAMFAGKYDAVLVDYNLGLYTGLDLIRDAVAHNYPAPLILFTGCGSFEVDVEAMQAGATLYLNKTEASPMLLERFIRYAIERKRIERDKTDILESIQDGFFALDRDWRFTFINRRAAQIGGLEPEQINGRTVWEAFPLLLGTQVEPYYRTSMQERKPVNFEVEGVSDGIWYAVSVYPHGEGITVFWQDITEIKKKEDALREAERSMHQQQAYQASLLDNLHDALVATDAERHITAWNQAAEKLYGYPAQEVLGMVPADVLKTELLEEQRDELFTRSEETGHSEIEVVQYTKDGRRIIVNVVLITLRDSSGRVTGYISANRDITDQKEAEARSKENSDALQRERARNEWLARIPEENPNPVVRLTEKGTILYRNQAARKLDWICEEGQTISGEILARIEEAVSQNNQLTFDASFSGKYYSIVIALVPEKKYANLYLRDITRMKQTEHLNMTLNHVNRTIYSTLDFSEVMQQALSVASQALGSETAAISLRRKGRWVVSYVHGFPPEVVGVEMDDDEERHAVLAIQTQKPVAVGDAFHDERVNQAHMQKWGIRSVLVVPILMRTDAIGVMFFNYQSAHFEFEEHHLQFGVNLAASISLALENARLIASLEDENDQRAQVEEELRLSNISLGESELRWATTLASIGDGVIVANENSRVTFINPIAEELTGWSLADSVGKHVRDVFQFTDEATGLPVKNPVERVLESGLAYTFGSQTRLICKDGRSLPVDDSCAPVKGPEGDITGAVLVFRDITRRKQMDKDLQDYARYLEQSNQELENFAYVASHDLQEPLRKIESFGRLLVNHAGPRLDDSDRDLLERMQKAAVRMGRMIEDLLTLSRVSSKGQPFIEVDLNQVAHAAVDDLAVRMEQTKGKVEIHSLPVIRADPSQMHQLFQNLIGNALKFHRPGIPPQVIVRSQFTGTRQVEIAVEDNGIGFDMSLVNRLFHPFQRLHNRAGYEGTGIGLSICRKIAERHKGTISAQGEPNQGAVFRVILPL